MIISISGVPGSGKTSVGNILAERLGLKFYSMGGLRGKMAMDRGMTIDQLNALGEKESSTDTEVDEYQRELGKKEDNFVIEGRLSWHFIPHSFKIFLDCGAREAARRIFSARTRESEERGDEPLYANEEATVRGIAERTASDVRRYEKYYGVDYRDPKQYDLILDTTDMKSPEETADEIINALRKQGLMEMDCVPRIARNDNLSM
ncbi:MAG TPA: cytidylate kinase family protein [Candidatus Methylomirabilis sp.]|nr:cytidylate kinase family protein [Candidatus Methylomirabilis sp.]